METTGKFAGEMIVGEIKEPEVGQGGEGIVNDALEIMVGEDDARDVAAAAAYSGPGARARV